MQNKEALSIPEMLGFAPIEPGRQRAFSQVSYQAQYLLYEDEAEELMKEFAPDEGSRKNAHPYIDKVLSLRYINDAEYRERVNGGYFAMEQKMRGAGVIPEEEEAIKRQMNRLTGGDGVNEFTEEPEGL